MNQYFGAGFLSEARALCGKKSGQQTVPVAASTSYLLWGLKYVDMTYFGLFGAPDDLAQETAVFERTLWPQRRKHCARRTNVYGYFIESRCRRMIGQVYSANHLPGYFGRSVASSLFFDVFERRKTDPAAMDPNKSSCYIHGICNMYNM